jgi:site-specific recombinase XerD
MSTKREVQLEEAIQAYLKSLEATGRSPRTLYTYGQDCKQIIAFFKAERALKNILPVHVAQFYKSAELRCVLPSGKERAPQTVQKTIRVLRMFFEWAKDQGYIETVPLPKKSP